MLCLVPQHLSLHCTTWTIVKVAKTMGFFCNTEVEFDESSFQHDKNDFRRLLCPERWSKWCNEEKDAAEPSKAYSSKCKRVIEKQSITHIPFRLQSPSEIVDNIQSPSEIVDNILRCVGEKPSDDKNADPDGRKRTSNEVEPIKNYCSPEEPDITLMLEKEEGNTDDQNNKKRNSDCKITFTSDKRRRLSSFILRKSFFEDHLLDESSSEEGSPDRANNLIENDSLITTWGLLDRAMERSLESRQSLAQQLSEKKA
jgi:hypothetical protein